MSDAGPSPAASISTTGPRKVLLFQAFISPPQFFMFGRPLAYYPILKPVSPVFGVRLPSADRILGEVRNLIIESLRIVVRAAKREELRRALAAWIGPTQVESGCLDCRILLEGNEPHSLCYEAQWKTPDDLMRHLRSEHYKRLLVLMDLGEKPPVVEFHTVTETKGLDLIQHARNVF